VYSYDALDRLEQIHNKTSGNANISRYEYSYNTRDVRTSVEQEIGSDPVQPIAFGYDTVDQLTSEISSDTPLLIL